MHGLFQLGVRCQDGCQLSGTDVALTEVIQACYSAQLGKCLAFGFQKFGLRISAAYLIL